MQKINMALVGCGGMGTRHLYGLRELARTDLCNLELVALCDIRRENAELAAQEAERLLGRRPAIYQHLAEMVEKTPGLDAVDVVTEPSAHHQVVCQALECGLHVIVEKPLGITVKACRRMIEAAERHGRKLAVAENYRRDPSARLVHALLEREAIGRPYMALLHAVSNGNEIFITPWRHLKEKSGLVVDLGVHYTDIIRYQLGDIEEIYGYVSLVEPVRYKPEKIGDTYTFYQRRFAAMEEKVKATAEDTSMALFKMESGIFVSWMLSRAGHGRHSGQIIFGDKGAIEGFGARGGSVRMRLAGKAKDLPQEEMVSRIPDFALDPLTDHFFPTKVSISDPAVDWKLIAVECHDFAAAILEDRPPEVDGLDGLKAVAAIYGIFESARAGRPVTMREVESGQVAAYQTDIDQALGI